MKKETTFTAKQVGRRIKERRTELNITMPELGRRVGVNKSTIQRYEADGVDPKRTMVINGLAEALLTTPEWLTGLSDDKEYDTYTLCQRDIEEHIKKYLDTVSHTVKGEPHQQLLTTFLGKMVDLYTVMTCYFADAMEEVSEEGYGVVSPQMDELYLEEPELIKQGGHFGVRLKASAPSYHIVWNKQKSPFSITLAV